MDKLQETLHPTRREALLTAFAAAGGALAPHAFAQGAWPNKPITLVVGYPPGGQTDFAGRAVLGGLQTALGQPVIIDNKAGANGNIGTTDVAKSPPDGYRLLVGNGGNMTLNPHTFPNLTVPDPTKFTPIGTLLTSSMMLVVPASLPVKTYAEFVTWLKAAKDPDYASAGMGSMSQVVMELLRGQVGKPKMTHIPFKGSGPAMTDLIAGRVSCMIDGASVVAPFVKSGQLRALMTTGTTRVPAFPDVPTALEVGLKDFQIIAFVGLYGPPGLDKEIVQKVNAALNATFKDPAVQKSITDRGDDPGGGTPDQLGAMTRRFHALWADVVKSNNIRAE